MAALVDEASLLLDAQACRTPMKRRWRYWAAILSATEPVLRHPDFAEAVRLAHQESRLSSLDYTLMTWRRSFTAHCPI